MSVDLDRDQLGIYFLDVGQGDCTVVVPPAAECAPILFDCADAFVARCFMATHDVQHLRAVVASHLDVDHIRGLRPFLSKHFEEGRRVERLFLALDGRADPQHRNEIVALLAQVRAWAEQPPHPGFSVESPFRTNAAVVPVAMGKGWRVDLVLPFLDDTAALNPDALDPNVSSVVLRVERGGRVVLVGGDAPLASWERLEVRLQKADVLRSPHHGGKIMDHVRTWESIDKLYQAVAPTLSVFSVGSHFQHGHPDADHARAATRNGVCRLLCTQVTPRCHLDPTEHRALALDIAQGGEPAFRHLGIPGNRAAPRPAEAPCAGTVVASVGPDGTLRIVPEPEGRHGRDLVSQFDGPACRGRGLATTQDDWQMLKGRAAGSPDQIRRRLLGTSDDDDFWGVLFAD
ncbi:MAG: hypothetical protein GXP62_00385 [Oligoflexia bacterium]|nr:hypothetical protein [Oligoflexia bacterium]